MKRIKKGCGEENRYQSNGTKRKCLDMINYYRRAFRGGISSDDDSSAAAITSAGKSSVTPSAYRNASRGEYAGGSVLGILCVCEGIC
jgi:hypothetical protein